MSDFISPSLIAAARLKKKVRRKLGSPSESWVDALASQRLILPQASKSDAEAEAQPGRRGSEGDHSYASQSVDTEAQAGTESTGTPQQMGHAIADFPSQRIAVVPEDVDVD